MTERIPIERAASRAEVEAAIQGMTEADTIRVDRFARFKAEQIGCLSAELLNEAIVAVLDPESRRRWEKDSVPFVQFLVGAIRSTASSWAKARSREPEFVTPVEGQGDPIQQAQSREANPDRPVIARAMVSEIRSHFREDKLVLDIMDGLSEGMSRAEIIDVLDLDATAYDTAVRRLRRGALSMFPERMN